MSRRSLRLLSLLSVVAGLTAVGCADASEIDEPTPEVDLTVDAQGFGVVGPIIGIPVDPKAIPVSGTPNAALAEVDDAVKAFMRATCTGAVSLSLGFGNAPILSRGYGYKSGPPNKACAAAGDPFVGGAVVSPNSAFRIGSNSKAITAAIVRHVLKQKLASLGRPSTDAAVEALEIFDPTLNLVSPRIRAAVYGANGGGPGAFCVPGRESQVLPNGAVDIRWRDITVGQLLGHRSGLPRGGNPVTSKLATLRSIDTLNELDGESSMVGAPGMARADVAGPNGAGRFIRPATLEEYILGNLDLCFDRSPGDAPGPGQDGYSNFAYGVLQHIAERVSGRPLTAPLGQPELHDQSLLGQFLAARLGITAGKDSADGIYMSQPIEDYRDPSEPRYRGWDGTSQNGLFWDTKRPWCTWNGTTCNGSAFDGGDRRYSWDWTKVKVGVSYTNEGVGAGVGLLAAEMPLYLRFMSKYWVSGSGSAPFYGRERAANPSTSTRWHIGELLGSHSTVAQFTGATVTYIKVPRTAAGELDMAKFHDALPMSACKLPAGLDLALAANQVNDASCTGICSERYMALRDVVKEALCKVDWAKANPQLF